MKLSLSLLNCSFFKINTIDKRKLIVHCTSFKMSLLGPRSKIVHALGFLHSVTKQKYLSTKHSNVTCTRLDE